MCYTIVCMLEVRNLKRQLQYMGEENQETPSPKPDAYSVIV